MHQDRARGREERGKLRALALCWLALLVGASLLSARFDDLPDTIPAYRTLLGSPSVLLPKSWFSVYRIVAMGVGQLGATTVMAWQALRAEQRCWARFWVAASLAASAKTFIESTQYALLGTVGGRVAQLTFLLAALLPVAAFLVVAFRLWKSRSLEPHRTLPFRGVACVAAFLLLWLLCATLPRLL